MNKETDLPHFNTFCDMKNKNKNGHVAFIMRIHNF